MKSLFALFAFALLSTPAYANERWYQIELFIFANNSVQGLIGERWRHPVATVKATAPTLEKRMQDGRYFFESVKQGDKQLPDIVAKMKKHWQYRPLLYSSWRQGFTTNAAAIPVYLSNNTVIKKSGAVSTSHFGDSFSNEALNNSGPVLQLSGTAAITLRRYLHLELKLNYNRLLNNKDKEQVRAIYQSLETDYLSFSIDESRRMRSKQAHYFDHPAFGVIALITPIEKNSSANEQQLKIETLSATDEKPVATTPRFEQREEVLNDPVRISVLQ